MHPRHLFENETIPVHERQHGASTAAKCVERRCALPRSPASQRQSSTTHHQQHRGSRLGHNNQLPADFAVPVHGGVHVHVVLAGQQGGLLTCGQRGAVVQATVG